MKVLQIFAAAMLMSVASAAYAETTNRFVKLEATDNALRDDANARLIVGITEQREAGSVYGHWVVFDLDFKRLSCLGPFDVDDGNSFYTLYINGQRLLSFNTNCQYSIGGAVGGDFRTSLIFTEVNQLELIGWLDDPVNDPIHAVVKLESQGLIPGDGPIILEGSLDVCPCWTLDDISALPIEGTTASCLTGVGSMAIVQNGICEHSYGIFFPSPSTFGCGTQRFDCPGLPDSGDGFIINDSEFSACRNQILHRCEELGIDPPPPPPITCIWIPDQTDGENCNHWAPGEPFPTRNGPNGEEPGWDQCTYIELCE